METETVLRNIWVMVLGLVLAAASVQAEPRIALVIGNSAYRSVTALPNPARDADLMARTLTGLGFDVTLVMDGDLAVLQSSISAFGGKLRAAGEDATGLFYYAGHGVQSFQRNYLLPVDAAPVNAADLGLVAIEAETVLRQMASARNRTNIVILDACRNNPFENTLEFHETGLAEMNAPTGTFLAYATAPNAVAMDGLGENSPFTVALATAMQTPGQPVEQVFKDVRVAVLAETQGLQTPWDASSLTADFVFVAAPQVAPEALAEAQLWTSVQAARDPVQVMLYMRAYPDSSHIEEARAFLTELMALEVAAPGAQTEPALVSEPPAGAPDPEEIAAFDAAQAAHTPQSYQDFVTTYPDSVFVEAARTEIAALQAALAGTDPEGPPVADAAGDTEVAAPDAVTISGPVTFTDPLTAGGEAVMGRSIQQVLTGSPLYPPIEGLPEEIWKDQTCSHCHQWTRESLCTQANVYVGENAARSVEEQHPLGGQFKQVLRAWAEGGCL